MAMTNVLVVEDEKIVSKDIQLSLKRLGYTVVGTADTADGAIAAAQEHRPDVILMDIILKGEKNGIDAATAIRAEMDIPIVYLTAHSDEATIQRAKESEPHGYILKPFKEVDIRTNIEMAIYKHSKENELKRERDMLFNLVEGAKGETDHIFVKSNSRFVKLKLDDLYFVEALKDYVVINTLEKRYTIHSTMKDIEARLPSDRFMRVHRSFIINVNRIAAIEQPNIILENDKKVVPIGGSYKEALSERINLM